MSRKRSKGGNNGTMSAVPSGAIKAIPRRGESAEAAIARVSAAHPGKTVVDPSPGGRRSSYSTRSVGPVQRVASVLPLYEAQRSSVSGPQYEVTSGPDGWSYSSPIFGDQVFTKRPQLIYMEEQAPDFATWTASGSVDVGMLQLQNYMQNQLFPLLVVKALENRNYLPVATLTTASDFTLWLSNLGAAFAFRFLEALLQLGADNVTSQKIQTALAPAIPQINLGLTRLSTIPCPEGLRSVLDGLQYVCAPEDSGCVIAHCSMNATSSPGNDLTSPTGINNIIAQANTALNALLSTANEANLITQIMGQNYGSRPLKPKTVYKNKDFWDQVIFGGIIYNNTTSGFRWPYPRPAGYLNNLVPIMKRQNSTDVRMMSYLRRMVHGETSGVGTPRVAGLCSQATSVGSYYGFYYQDGTGAQLPFQVAGTDIVTFSTEFSNLFWSYPAGIADTSTTSDVRIVPEEMVTFYLTEAELAKNTLFLVNEIFLMNQDPLGSGNV